MAPTDISLALFAFFNSLRVFSYVPQIVRVLRGGNGASAISSLTWSVWTCANASTAAYALINVEDVWLAFISAANAACCAIVIGLTMWKRARFHALAAS